MPSSTRTATPGPSNLTQGPKRPISDAEPSPKDPKKSRIESLPDAHTKRDSSRDTKRRRRKKKKAPIVSAGGPRKESTPSRTEERPLSQRASLWARSEIIRFSSAAPEADPSTSAMNAAEVLMQGPSSAQLLKSGESPSRSSNDNPNVEPAGETMPSSPMGKKAVAPPDKPIPKPQCNSLEDTVAQLTQELKSKNDLIASHRTLLNQVQQAVTCQICLDLMYKPYALAPCGHLACYSCLVQWFRAPPPDNRPAPQAIMRKKTCPHCRAVVRDRPIEVWAVKGIAQSVGKSGLAPIQIPAHIDPPESMNANPDPWKDIFPHEGGPGRRRFPWFFPDAHINDDDDIPIANIAPRGEDVGMLDLEDGGIYRCLDCMHEIWDGLCTSCGRVYPGHRPDVDDAHEDDEDDAIGWWEEQMGAEEVDMADDPGWMGLEGGDGDDDGDDDNWPGHFGAPWRHRMHMFGGPFGFVGTVHLGVDEDEDDEEEGEGDDLHVSDGERERSRDRDDDDDDDEGDYESSFIDDEDEAAIAVIEDGPPRIYEISDDGEGEDYLMNRHYSIGDTDEDEDDHGDGEYHLPEPRQAEFTRLAMPIWSDDEDALDSEVAPMRTGRPGSGRGGGGSGGGRLRRGRGIIESDDSEVEFLSGE
ncbi:hypothetical protein PAXRUDRAFT_827981 [Paxillus rubicundulus Ve08.2h10]|uniref:RING-type domain-containing protein n=1 Tax=Paxillus rubicundulus Ve08.2h10 TaxID=930991 RepID=A0A0D0E7Z8_9AGAM|nr:hypothetical protein PAXRUDRAFT_827981 [Paxillus rubicundulus Ve08.2h10]